MKTKMRRGMKIITNTFNGTIEKKQEQYNNYNNYYINNYQ
jgi:hypothetical protein